MLMDAENMFSTGQAITGTTKSTNVIKFVTPGEFRIGDRTVTSRLPIPAHYRDLGRGEKIQLHIQVVEDFVGGNSVQVQLITADNEDLDENPVTLATTEAVPVAQLKAGYTFTIESIPIGATKQFLGLNYVVDGSPTQGKIDAGIVASRQTSL